MELLGYVIMSLMFLALPLLVPIGLILLVVWLIVRDRRQARERLGVYQSLGNPNAQAVSSEYVRGVRDALEQVRRTPYGLPADTLEGIEQILTAKPAAEVANTPPVPQPQEEVEPEVYQEEGVIPTTTPPEQMAVQHAVEASVGQQPTILSTAPSFNGLNLLLSLGSLLFVAAGVAFIASPFADGVKLFVLCLIVALFYGGGMMLYLNSVRLRPAAVAFIGTGLALVPFLGIAFVQYTMLSPAHAWLLVSFVGMIAYIMAAVVLKSQLVSYLSVAFVLSLTASSVASMQAPIVGYFVGMMIVSLAASVVARFWPGWIPGLFKAPIVQTGNFVTPLAMFASLVFALQLDARDFEVIFILATFQYAVAWWQTRIYWYESIVRVLAHITALICIGDITDGESVRFGAGFVITAALQAVYSLVRWRSSPSRGSERAWFWVMLGCIAIAPVFWSGSQQAAMLTACSYGILLFTSGAALVTTRRYEYGFMAVYAGLILPIVIGFGVAMPAWPQMAVSAVYASLVAGALAYRRWAQSTLAGINWVVATLVGIYLGVAYVCAIFEPNGTVSVIGLVAMTALTLAVSYAYRAAWMTILVLVGATLTFVRHAWGIDVSMPESAVIITGGMAIVSYGMSVVLLACRDRIRGNISVAAGHVYTFLLFCLAIPMAYGLTESTILVVATVLTVWSIGMVIVLRRDEHAPRRRLLHMIAYPIFYSAALVYSLGLASGWQLLVTVVGAILAWEASYRLRVSYLLLAGNIFTVWALSHFVGLIGIPASYQTYVSFLVASGLFYGAYWWFKFKQDKARYDSMGGSAWVASAVAWLASLSLDAGWQVLVLAVLTGMLWEASYSYRRPVVVVFANLATAWMIGVLFGWIWPGSQWTQLGTYTFVTALFYSVAKILSRYGDVKRSGIMLASVWAAAGVGYITGLYPEEVRVLASLLGIFGAATIVEYGLHKKRSSVAEVGVYIGTVCFLTYIHTIFPSLNMLFTAHIAAVAVAAVAWARGHDVRRYIVAAAIVSGVGSLYALSEGGLYSLVFLVEHILLSTLGVIARRRWAVWWGIIGAVLAVFYYLRESPYLVFTFLGTLIVSFVIWRLRRSASR